MVPGAVWTALYRHINNLDPPTHANDTQAMVMGLGAMAVMQQKMTGEQLTSFLFYVNFVSAASFDVGDRWTSIQVRWGCTSVNDAIYSPLAYGGVLSMSTTTNINNPDPIHPSLTRVDHRTHRTPSALPPPYSRSWTASPA